MAYAAACKAVYPGSIPGVASILFESHIGRVVSIVNVSCRSGVSEAERSRAA